MLSWSDFYPGLGCHYFGPKTQNTTIAYHLRWLYIVFLARDEDNNGAEQPLTIEKRLERRPEKKPTVKIPLRKKKKKKQETMAHAPAIGSLSYGGFTRVRLSIVL